MLALTSTAKASTYITSVPRRNVYDRSNMVELPKATEVVSKKTTDITLLRSDEPRYVPYTPKVFEKEHRLTIEDVTDTVNIDEDHTQIYYVSFGTDVMEAYNMDDREACVCRDRFKGKPGHVFYCMNHHNNLPTPSSSSDM